MGRDGVSGGGRWGTRLDTSADASIGGASEGKIAKCCRGEGRGALQSEVRSGSFEFDSKCARVRKTIHWQPGSLTEAQLPELVDGNRALDLVETLVGDGAVVEEDVAHVPAQQQQQQQTNHSVFAALSEVRKGGRHGMRD